MRLLHSLLVSRNFLRAAAWPILPLVVLHAVHLAKHSVATAQEVVGGAMMVSVNSVRCIAWHVLAVEMKLRFPSGQAKIVLCTAAIVFNCRVPVAVTTVDRASGRHESSSNYSWWILRVRSQAIQPQGSECWHPRRGSSSEILWEPSGSPQTQSGGSTTASQSFSLNISIGTVEGTDRAGQEPHVERTGACE